MGRAPPGVVAALMVLHAGEAGAQVPAASGARPAAVAPGEDFPEIPEIPERAVEAATPHRRRSVHLFGGVSVDLTPGGRPGPAPTFTLTTGIDSPWLRVESYFGVGPKGTASEAGAEARYQPWLAGLRACVWLLERPDVWNGLGLGFCLGGQSVVNGSGLGATNRSPTLGALVRADVGEVVRLVALAELGFGLTPGRIVHTDFDARAGARREALLFETAPAYGLVSLRLEFATPEPPPPSPRRVP